MMLHKTEFHIEKISPENKDNLRGLKQLTKLSKSQKKNGNDFLLQKSVLTERKID